MKPVRAHPTSLLKLLIFLSTNKLSLVGNKFELFKEALGDGFLD
jgi:hypothetical protein